ncbi:MAG TPA: hypothetical protein VGI57_06795, partial [Usitatibacter sp.]
TYGLELPPAAKAYVERLLALDSMKKWYDAALKETFRDEPHERDTAKYGKVLQDLRVAPKVAAPA